jgi:hypothetical protein
MRRLIALHDQFGSILAAAIDDGINPVPTPVATIQGHEVTHVDLEDELASLSAGELATRFRVEGAKRRLVAVEVAGEDLGGP